MQTHTKKSRHRYNNKSTEQLQLQIFFNASSDFQLEKKELCSPYCGVRARSISCFLYFPTSRLARKIPHETWYFS